MSEESFSNSGPLVPDFAVVECKIGISVVAHQAWETIGNYADAGKYLDVASEQIFGNGGIGSVRTIAGSIVEVMVGKGPLSYTYTQTSGPMAAYSYHGSVALEANGDRSSTLTYTINYDQASMSESQRVAALQRIRPRFDGMIQAMKEAAESAAG